MPSEHQPGVHRPTLAAQIQDDLGVNINRCYQCGKCAAGCPVGQDMDINSFQALRLLQFGDEQWDLKVLKSEGIWLCLACETCTTRCPQEVAITRIMDFLRTEAVRQGLAHPKSKDILAFHQAFMDSVKVTGRLYEIGMVADYKTRRSRHLLKDLLLAPKMYVRGKLPIFPHLINGRAVMKRIFKRTLGRKK